MFDWLTNGHKSATRVELVVSNKTVIKVLALVIVSFMFLAAVRESMHVLTLLFISFFLAVALDAPVRWLAQQMPGKTRGNRTIATGVSFLLIVLVLGSFLASIVPPLVRQTSNFLRAVPGIVDDVRDENTSLGRFVRNNNLEDQIDKLSGELSSRFGDIGGTAVSTASRVGGSIFSTLTVLVLTFMMLVEGPHWLGFFRRMIPASRREHTDKLLAQMYRVVRGYINGQVVLAATAALIILIPLFVLDISYPIALMVIVFLCGLIPMIGHYFGAAIVTLVALFTSPVAALIIFIYYVLYQQLENYVVQPTIQSNATNMSPLLVFASVLIGASLGGILGGLIAIPVAGCIRVLMLDYLTTRKYLEELPKKETKKSAA
jgi:predicted PurR-regulated permease PerM